ncbi:MULTISPECIES: SCP2 sterol-binding domain-containing protein [Kitasatospora]|uniref:Sterol carrier protein n=2 Tax=Kitasatospora TaxID=2063 RepID=A0ABT1IT13_9ACTN|nr:SCP2 sterol-binding domain-containing protein [Kitasatospora paracochleata]MCP2308270.1 putative sterol carrier protein [Kitasatospora paracochleata]
MPAFPNAETAAEVFGELFTILAADEEFTAKLRENDLTARLVHTKPDCTIFLSADKVIVGPEAPEDAAITIKMSCDTAHQLWLGKLMMPAAVATGKVRIRGKVAKVLELVPILRPAFDRYPELAAARGIGA